MSSGRSDACRARARDANRGALARFRSHRGRWIARRAHGPTVALVRERSLSDPEPIDDLRREIGTATPGQPCLRLVVRADIAYRRRQQGVHAASPAERALAGPTLASAVAEPEFPSQSR